MHIDIKTNDDGDKPFKFRLTTFDPAGGIKSTYQIEVDGYQLTDAGLLMLYQRVKVKGYAMELTQLQLIDVYPPGSWLRLTPIKDEVANGTQSVLLGQKH
jgi:hypothetical protein